MKRLLLPLLVLACASFAETRLGKPLAIERPTPIADVVTNPDKYTGKFVQVRGKVTDVCQNMGCWTILSDGTKTIRIKVRDGEIVFPKDSLGKTVVAEGKLLKLQLTKEQAIERAKHEAEENGRKFDPASITGPVTLYQIQGTGAVILD